MSRFVFLGPSLAPSVAAEVTDATLLPPVRQGDVQRLVTQANAECIAIIDGYFSQTPAVWHKEILWALERGVRVLGGGSMGALRAAELARFGMVGVGVVFQAYRDGRFPGFDDDPFEDDDEVAVIHGPIEAGYAVASEAMVNIRATLNRARDEQVVDQQTCARLAAIAKQRFYAERSHTQLVDDARGQGIDPELLDQLSVWWPDGRVDQKAIDAIAVLAALDERADAVVPFVFQHSAAFDALAHSVNAEMAVPVSPEVEELQLDPARWQAAIAAVAARALGLERNDVTSRDHAVVLATDLSTTRVTDHIGQPNRLRDWLDSMPRSVLFAHLERWLRQDETASPLLARAQAKRRALAALPPVPAAHTLHGVDQLQLEDWYFSDCLGRWIPDDVRAYALDMGFVDLTAFHHALLREHRFRGALAESSPC